MKKRSKQFKDYECSTNNLLDNYIVLTKSMLLSEKWLLLRYSTRDVYIKMKLWSMGNSTFDYSYKLAEKEGITSATYKRAIKELVDNGFIEIIRISREIDTFDISTEPYEDCCTVFTPRHPRTKPKMDMLIAEDQKLNCDALIEEAVLNARKESIY